MDEDEYEVGYKKPPKEHRFQKGKSGNPKGRARKPAGESGLDIDVMGALSSALKTKGRAVINGKLVKISMEEGVVKRQVHKALDGHIAAIKQVLGALPSPVNTFTLVVIDEEGNKTVHPPQRDCISSDDRPEKPLGWFERLIRREVKKKMTITVDGQEKTVTILEAILLKLVIKARNGNDRAVLMLRKNFPDVHDEVIDFTPDFGTKDLRDVPDEPEAAEEQVEERPEAGDGEAAGEGD